jgi:capsular polysaccharide biosynthesis protein
MNEWEDPASEVVLMDYLTIIWKRKWLIIIPTVLCAVLAGVISFVLPPQWEVDILIVPSKYIVQTEQGQFAEVLVVDPKQVAALINQKSFDNLIVKELNLDARSYPEIKAENLRDTKLVKISVRDTNISRAKSILLLLFVHLKNEFDKQANVQFKDIDTQIAFNENQINYKELVIRDSLYEIKLFDIEINKAKQEILSLEQKLLISDERVKSLLEEMKTAKTRIGDIETQQKINLTEPKEGAEAISNLLYANEIQNNLAYYNTLDEKLSMEKIAQENVRLSMKDRNDKVKQLYINMDESRNEIDKVKIEIENIKNQIALLAEKKARIDYTQLIKEPTASLFPVSPKKAKNTLIAGILGLLIFSIVAFFLEHIEKQKK